VRVIHGDIADIDLLRDESVATMDVIVAATGQDTSNIVACAFAAAEGKAFTVAVLHRLALLPIVNRFGIDATLSPRTASANAVLQQLRGGGGSVATFLDSDVEVNEFVVQAGSPADGSVVADMRVPRSILLGAVVRGHQSVEIVRGGTRIIGGDRVVVFSRAGDLDIPRVVGVKRQVGVGVPRRSVRRRGCGVGGSRGGGRRVCWRALAARASGCRRRLVWRRRTFGRRGWR